jgi:hypothetical protein
MEQGKVQLRDYHCGRCGHEWLPRKSEPGEPVREPRTGPKCESAYWNVPRKVKRDSQ